MNKNLFTLAALALVAGSLASCSSKKAEKADTAVVVEEEIVVEKDSIAKIFDNPDLKSDVATDTTYAVTDSGLRYMIVNEGKGKSPKATDVVTVHYSGKLPTGFEFDSSYQRGEPTSFPLNGVIAGWTEGLQLMKEGGKAVFYIPAALAYGAAGAPPMIGPDQDLIFTVELIEVNAPEK